MGPSARLAVLCVAAIGATDCWGDSQIFRLPAAPSAVTPPLPPSQTVREITIGETIKGDITDAGSPCTRQRQRPVPCQYYALTPAADGTVTATLTWDPVTTNTILLLRMEGKNFESLRLPW